MKTKLSVLVISFLFMLSGNLKLSAQVTIGNNESPVDGALLQVKDKAGVNDDSENATKGFAYPRVKLEQRNQLYPMYKGKLEYTTDKTNIDKRNTGLTVYNTHKSADGEANENLIFQKGLYVWTGAKWESVGTPQVENGLSMDDQNVIRLGGDLTDDTSVNLDGNPLNFETGGSPLYINGLTDITSNTRALVVSTATGQIGRAGVTPALLTFVQSTIPTPLDPSEGQAVSGLTEIKEAALSATGANQVPGTNATTSNLSHPRIGSNLNWGKQIIIPFRPVDIEINNDLTDTIFSDPVTKTEIIAFELIGNFSVELSGYINYTPKGTNSSGDAVLLNVTIQIKKEGTNDWIDYSSVRSIMASPMPYYVNTINIPPAIYEGKKGDQIRMIMQRPYSEEIVSGNKRIRFLGAAHGGTIDGATRFKNVEIAVPWGTQFSSGLKITAVG